MALQFTNPLVSVTAPSEKTWTDLRGQKSLCVLVMRAPLLSLIENTLLYCISTTISISTMIS